MSNPVYGHLSERVEFCLSDCEPSAIHEMSEAQGDDDNEVAGTIEQYNHLSDWMGC